MLDVLEARGANNDSVMLVGHNPGMTELANQVSDARIDNMPTCAMLCVTAHGDWDTLRNQPGEFSEWHRRSD